MPVFKGVLTEQTSASVGTELVQTFEFQLPKKAHFEYLNVYLRSVGWASSSVAGILPYQARIHFDTLNDNDISNHTYSCIVNMQQINNRTQGQIEPHSHVGSVRFGKHSIVVRINLFFPPGAGVKHIPSMCIIIEVDDVNQ